MEMTITLPKNEYALLKSRKARCEYTNGPEGTFKLGSKTLRSTSAGSTGTLFSIPVDGGKGWQGDGCDWEDEIRLLSISGDSEIRAYVGLLIKNKTADFTLTRGPKSGHTISIALDGIQEALQAAKCSDVNIAAYLSNR